MKIIYTAEATARGGREGSADTSDGSLHVDLSVPPQMGGSGKTGTNPEQLFACGYAACFGSSIQFVAQRSRLPKPTVTVHAKVGIGPNSAGGYGLEVTLEVVLAGMSQTQADELVAAAHEVCPYSNATRGNIPVTITTTVSNGEQV